MLLKIHIGLQKYTFSHISFLIRVGVTSIKFKATHKGKILNSSLMVSQGNKNIVSEREYGTNSITTKTRPMFYILINYKAISFEFFKIYYFYFMFISVLPTCMSV